MKKYFISAIVIFVSLSLLSCSGTSKGKALVKVGGQKITEGDLDMLGSINPRIAAEMKSEFGRKKILDNLVEQELLYQASTKEGLHRKPEIQDKIDIYKKVIISQAYMDKQMEETAKKYYDDHKKDYEKLKFSHIMIKFPSDDKNKKRSEKDALEEINTIKAKINGGEDFAAAAKELSEDTLTNKRGGDLGFASLDEARLTRRGFEPLLEKAFTMKVGEIAGPIKTDKGYHIITVTQGAELQPFDAVAQGIMFKIRANARNDIFAQLREKYKVEYLTDQPQNQPAQGKVEPQKEETQEEVKIEEEVQIDGGKEGNSTENNEE